MISSPCRPGRASARELCRALSWKKGGRLRLSTPPQLRYPYSSTRYYLPLSLCIQSDVIALTVSPSHYRKSATATALIASPFDIDRKGKKRAAPSSSPPVKTSTGSSSARHHKRPRVTAPGDIGRYSLRQKVPSPDDQSAQQSKSKGKGKGKATVGTKKKFSASMPKKAK